MLSRIRTLLLVMLAIGAGLPARSNAETQGSTGAVFVMTNAASGNEIIAYKRNGDGSLEQGRSFSTGGRGSGGVTDPLGSQGSLTLTDDRSFLLAVNAGSGSISVFRVHGIGFRWWTRFLAVAANQLPSPSTETSFTW
jgi:6-phosphogluconolactonase